MTLHRTGWKVCTEGCCVAVEDTELLPPRASVAVTRPMYQVMYDHRCYSERECKHEWGTDDGL